MDPIVCPSGLTGTIRTLKTADLAVLSDRRLFKQPGPAIEAALLDRAWVETLDVGPYGFAGSRPPWKGEVLTGDLFFALRAMRIATWGDKYDFDAMCSTPGCRGVIKWTVDLSELPTIALTDEARELVARGNKFTAELAGRRFVYQLPTGATGVKAEKLGKEHGDSIHVLLSARILELEGATSPAEVLTWIGELEARDGNRLREILEAQNCGIETEIEVDCDDCGRTQKVTVPFGAGFFLPETKRASGRR